MGTRHKLALVDSVGLAARARRHWLFGLVLVAALVVRILTALAFRHRDKFIERNLQIVLRNLPLLTGFFARYSNIFDWTPPNAATIGFARFKPQQDVHDWCENLVRDAGVLLLPGTVYDESRHIRFGYGRKNMPESLAQFDAYLKSASFARSA